MPRWQLGYLAGCAAIIGGCLSYTLSDFGGWPLLMYEPYERIWLIANEAPSPAAMVYPGLLLWGMFGAVMGASLSLVGMRRLSGQASDSILILCGGWALSALVFSAMYFLWGLWPF